METGELAEKEILRYESGVHHHSFSFSEFCFFVSVCSFVFFISNKRKGGLYHYFDSFFF